MPKNTRKIQYKINRLLIILNNKIIILGKQPEVPSMIERTCEIAYSKNREQNSFPMGGLNVKPGNAIIYDHTKDGKKDEAQFPTDLAGLGEHKVRKSKKLLF